MSTRPKRTHEAAIARAVQTRGEATDAEASDEARQGRGLARVFSAFSNPLRVRILKILTRETACVSDFVGALGIDQPKVSQHLAILREAGLIACKSEGRRRCYSARHPERVRELLQSAYRLSVLAGEASGSPECHEE